MALDASPWAAEPVERRPGDFARRRDGTPSVADPAGTLTKSGPRKGLPLMVMYGRPSGFGKQIEDGYNLAKWSQRTLVLGIGEDYATACAQLETPKLAALCATLVGVDRGTKEWKAAADGIVVEALRLGKANLSADRGTQAHAVTEEVDEGRDPIAIYERGEALGLDAEVQTALVGAWQEMLAREGLEIIATEFCVVHDRYRMAGTADRMARLTKVLRFVLVSGEIVELPVGSVVVLDIKSGQLRKARDGSPTYWNSYSVQIAVYSGGQLYDPDTDVRSPFPWDVDQHWALIAHLDVLGALAGKPSCELVLVDIEAGRAAADLCLAAKQWERRTDVFSVAMHNESAAAVGVLTPPAAAAPTNQELHARLRRHPDIDEGTVADPDGLDRAFGLMAEHFIALDPAAKSWAAALQVEAQQHGCGFHAREAHTLRRFEIIHGLIAMCVAELDDSDLLRMLVEHVTGDDVAQWPAIKPGHALGAMDAQEATRFAAIVDLLVVDAVQLRFTEAGRPRFVARAA